MTDESRLGVDLEDVANSISKYLYDESIDELLSKIDDLEFKVHTLQEEKEELEQQLESYREYGGATWHGRFGALD